MSITRLRELALEANNKQAGVTLPPSWILELLHSHAELLSAAKNAFNAVKTEALEQATPNRRG